MAVDDRGRIFAVVFYPDSMPPDYLDIIKAWHIPACLSPLHDMDLNPLGDEKKPHYHLILKFEGKKSIDQVKALTDQLHGVRPIKVDSELGMLRYFCHLDNPDKYQYSISELKVFSGYDLEDLTKPSSSLRKRIMEDMYQFIIDNDVKELEVLFDEAYSFHCDTWFYVLNNFTCFGLHKLLASRRGSSEGRRLENLEHAVKEQREQLDSLNKQIAALKLERDKL